MDYSKAEDKRSFASSSSSKMSFQPFTEYERGIKRSSKEGDEKQGSFLTAMSPKTGEESSSESSSDTPREKSIDPFGLESSSDSGETEKYSPTNPREISISNLSSLPRRSPPVKGIRKHKKESSFPARKSAKGNVGKSPAVPRHSPVHEWGTPEEPKDKPRWGRMKIKEHYQEEDSWNEEWAIAGEQALRRSRDLNMRGCSPPPKDKGES